MTRETVIDYTEGSTGLNDADDTPNTDNSSPTFADGEMDKFCQPCNTDSQTAKASRTNLMLENMRKKGNPL